VGISVGHLLVVLLIVVLLFGTKRLATFGRDLGAGLKGFREAMRESSKEEPADKPAERREPERMIEGKAEQGEK
jgi:sec-independent protein translocase protein TatA